MAEKDDKLKNAILAVLERYPEALLSLLPEKMLPEKIRASVAAGEARVKVVPFDRRAASREIVSFPYDRDDPLLLFIKEHPAVVPDLLSARCSTSLPEYDEVIAEEADLDRDEPQAPTHTVLLLRLRGRVVGGIVVDVLRCVVPDKRYRWPLNAANLHFRVRDMTYLVVVAADTTTETWAKEPHYWSGPDKPFIPLVLGPCVVSPERAGESGVSAVRAAFARLFEGYN